MQKRIHPRYPVSALREEDGMQTIPRRVFAHLAILCHYDACHAKQNHPEAMRQSLQMSTVRPAGKLLEQMMKEKKRGRKSVAAAKRLL